MSPIIIGFFTLCYSRVHHVMSYQNQPLWGTCLILLTHIILTVSELYAKLSFQMKDIYDFACQSKMDICSPSHAKALIYSVTTSSCFWKGWACRFSVDLIIGLFTCGQIERPYSLFGDSFPFSFRTKQFAVLEKIAPELQIYKNQGKMLE